jgi:Uma2 family endonuclease
MQLVIELPPRQQQLAFNRQRWTDVLADCGLADLPYRIETNVHGQIIMTPPPSGSHSTRQGKITVLLDRLLGGNSLPECPISTIDGVKAADVGWYSESRFTEVRGQVAFEQAPEICVEVLSPSNTNAEMQQKRELYIEAGADEVWICDREGRMSFFLAGNPNQPEKKSIRCPQFPSTI